MNFCWFYWQFSVLIAVCWVDTWKFSAFWVVICYQTFILNLQLALSTNEKLFREKHRVHRIHQIYDLRAAGLPGPRSGAHSRKTHFLGIGHIKPKVCPDIRIGICSLNLYADIWANFGRIWPIPKKSGSFGLGTSCLRIWATQVTYLMVRR